MKPADYCQRILDSLALWEAQDRAMVAAIVKQSAPAPATLSLASYKPGARHVVASAQSLADERKHVMMTSLHVFARLLTLAPLHERVRACGADPDAALAAAESWLKDRPRSEKPSYLGPEALAMLKRAEKEANGQSVSLMHLIRAFIAPPAPATVEELDERGTDHLEEEEARQRVITAGRLDLFVAGAK